MTHLNAILLPLSLLAAGASAAPTAAPSLEARLRAEDERLLAAVHQGGREEWSRITTPDFIYVEEGGIQAREQFLAQLVPDGHRPLRIEDFRVVRSGDLAIVVHHDSVPDPMSGEPTRSRYVMTETWQLIGGRWMLHFVHVDAVRAAPPVASLTVAELDALAGTYTRAGRTLTIRREGAKLVASSEREPAFTLEPETRDVFFDRSALRLRWIFRYDAERHLIGVVSRDENHDGPVWSRAD